MPPKKPTDITVRLRKARLPFASLRVIRAARAFLAHEGVTSAGLSFVFLDGSAIRRINREYLGHDFVTDVVTFDLRDNKQRAESRERRAGDAVASGLGMIANNSLRSKLYAPCSIEGEIYICPAEAARNARAYGESVEREILRYVAHGILHLLGYDDGSAKERAEMRRREDELLKLETRSSKSKQKEMI